jgi:hypothetical protein
MNLFILYPLKNILIILNTMAIHLSLGNVDLIPLMEGEGRTLRVLGFNTAQRAVFLQTLNRLVNSY